MNKEMRAGKKVGFISLGCPKNQCDTEVMLHTLLTAGYEITAEETEADVVVINTCGFIESAKKESIDSILDIAWLKDNRELSGIVVTGCLAERYREELLSELPEIDAIIGIGGLDKITDACDAVLFGEKEEKYVALPAKDACGLGGDRIITTGEVYAYLKISEGCDNRCAYCAIPSIRGDLRSRTVEDIVSEAKDLDGMGIRELVIVAQDTTVYGRDIYGRLALPELIRAICKETKIPWIRLLYCYPDKITDELIEEIKTNDRIVKYIDLPIQHISDNMLTAMNRHGDAACIKDAIRRLREIDGMVIRTTAIVGFPGETEADFCELCEFVKEAKFERFGAFPYSREEDTPAYSFEGQIDEQVKQDRFDIVMRHQMDISEAYNESFVGTYQTVLCEGFDEVSESYFGRTYRDAAEIDGKVWFTAKHPVTEGEFVSVKITEALDYDLVGEVTV